MCNLKGVFFMEREEIIFINNYICQIRDKYKKNYIQLELERELLDKGKLNIEESKNMIRSINEIQEDLDMRFKFNGYDDEFYKKFNKQICIVFKNIKTKEFYNKFFDYSVVYPKRKSTTTLAYILYYLYQLEDYEIYILNNILRSQNNQRRAQENIIFSNVLYIDIDHVKGSENLDINSHTYSEELCDLLYENYDFLNMFEDLEFNYNCSGSGLHLYFKIETLYMNKNNTKKYLDIARSLTEIFNGDFNCIDIARILRPVNSYNKKDKFITPKRVEMLGMGNCCKAYSLDELEKMINKYYNSQKRKFTKEELEFGFFEIENDENVFEDTPCFPASISEKEDINKEIKHKIPKQNKEIFYLSEYKLNEEFPNHYLIQDLLFYIKNRNGNCNGYRRNLLFAFYFCFKKYCLMSELNTRKYVYKVNKLFREQLAEKEIEELLNYLSDYELYRGIANNKISALFNFKDEEIKFMRGIYNVSTEERKHIRLERNRQLKKEKYVLKKPTHKQIIICINNNQEKTNKEIAELIGVSVRTIQRVKKEL